MSIVISLICTVPTPAPLRTTPLSVFIKTTDMPLIGTDTGSHYSRGEGGCGGRGQSCSCLTEVLCQQASFSGAVMKSDSGEWRSAAWPEGPGHSQDI
ncbi:Anhydro-N-acetylmuramic acid kinase [Dissostichus eleginoides]|uniref:Anhydro-N-acetylmuramic acid kinase n=1 Tax=Dissostichus eleginoides TaxID=100907 RepID=A0AAD9BMM0_DISEL|nr:Anhydro-N-acetylmuramic acid kinase [Dissostichus eleginoides]